jgi:aminoglycoside 6'-N-acetyltransferase I
MANNDGSGRSMKIRRARRSDRDEWLRLRALLWPEYSLKEHKEEMERFLKGRSKAVFVAAGQSSRLFGFVEANIREFADACDTQPVGYVEGWYVDPEMRRRGIGRRLVRAAEDWARQKGCVEMGSDCLLENQMSREAHLAIGYEERERLIHFRKWLGRRRTRTPM